MLKFITTALFCLILASTLGQKRNSLSTYLSFQYNKTLHDIVIGNNPWGVGIGLQTYLNVNSKFKPLVDLTGDLYLESDKIGYAYADGTPIKDVGGMVNLFVGSLFLPSKDIYISFVAGPSFINGQALLGVKPSFGFYFSDTKRWTGKVSYINIFNRDKISKNDFGSLSFAISVRLF